MKKLVALSLSCAFLLTGCSTGDIAEQLSETVSVAGRTTEPEKAANTETVTISEYETDTKITEQETKNTVNENAVPKYIVPEFADLDDPNLLRYVEDSVYADLVTQLNSDDYFVENVSAVYVSKEYLEEIAYNSQANIYFGYTLEELEEQFQGAKFVFDLGENGQTVVHEFEEYDDTYNKVIKNTAIGTGIILICVTVSAVSAGTGAAAVSAIFAASAKSGTILALSSGTISGVTAGVVKGIETKNFDEALKAAALKGSKEFKFGAIFGSIMGGAGEAIALHGATLNGLTMNEAATIQKESKYPLDIIKQFKSIEEYNVYKNAGLKTQMVNGKLALVRDIDLKFKSTLANGTEVTNLERMAQGLAPIDPTTGKYYQLHHINQNVDGTLAILTESEHQGNSSILNTVGKESEIIRSDFDKTRKAFWKSFAESFM
ncbi:MAG: HNH/ENDO VII family nuclease [Ruminococcus sp.]|nr:HNH/ENDO VII family nuclease [Ruminococcus sp.]MCM1380685.1 HNH/ENDO VII family nuclease [Muribaculaceae bacterium]MCM1479850.1 HNH/ENDO VII family nuclease [Muribaculaceae bacterium]